MALRCSRSPDGIMHASTTPPSQPRERSGSESFGTPDSSASDRKITWRDPAILWRDPGILFKVLIAKTLSKNLYRTVPVAMGLGQIGLAFWILTDLESPRVKAWSGEFPFALATFLMMVTLQFMVALPIHALLPQRVQDSVLSVEERPEDTSHQRLDPQRLSQRLETAPSIEEMLEEHSINSARSESPIVTEVFPTAELSFKRRNTASRKDWTAALQSTVQLAERPNPSASQRAPRWWQGLGVLAGSRAGQQSVGGSLPSHGDLRGSHKAGAMSEFHARMHTHGGAALVAMHISRSIEWLNQGNAARRVARISCIARSYIEVRSPSTGVRRVPHA